MRSCGSRASPNLGSKTCPCVAASTSLACVLGLWQELWCLVGGGGVDRGLGTFFSLVLAPVDALRFTMPDPNLHSPGDSASLQTPVLPTAK